MRKIFKTLLVVVFILVLVNLGGISLDYLVKNRWLPAASPKETQVITSEESVVVNVVKKAIPSVVTIGIDKVIQTQGSYRLNPLDPFNPFVPVPGKKQEIKQNIGSGFIISKDGLILTNKHVVGDTSATYKVITNDDKKYDVEKIYRDPLNDLAILKVTAENLTPLEMGDSSTIQLGQMAVAVGTPLGEFRNTVTAGIISGLGRGITAGSPLEASVEQLDDVIQTDAAINPGNSGGPLLNSSGQVIGINTAIASEGQNIGFAIPINTAKKVIDAFNNNGGTFDQAYLGVRYKMISQSQAILNELPQGAYVIEVVEDSPAAKAGIKNDDIMLTFDSKKLESTTEGDLAKLVNTKKPGDVVVVELWRDGDKSTVKVTLDKVQ